MNVALFTAQLNQLLQTGTPHLEGVCDLLRVHIGAGISVEEKNGKKIIEIFGENSAKKILSLELLQDFKIIFFHEKNFTEDEILAINIAQCVITILLRHREENFSAEKKRRARAVRAIINSLSFSELEAAGHILKSLDKKGEKNEGLLIAGHIADKLGFTRSVVTSALRKLEGANLIETRSLGMKGTYIRVKDTLLTEELGKL